MSVLPTVLEAVGGVPPAQTGLPELNVSKLTPYRALPHVSTMVNPTAVFAFDGMFVTLN